MAYIPRHSAKQAMFNGSSCNISVSYDQHEAPTEEPRIELFYSSWPVSKEATVGDIVLIDLELTNLNDYPIDCALHLESHFQNVFNKPLKVEDLKPHERANLTVKGFIQQLDLAYRTVYTEIVVSVNTCFDRYRGYEIPCQIAVKF